MEVGFATCGDGIVLHNTVVIRMAIRGISGAATEVQDGHQDAEQYGNDKVYVLHSDTSAL